MGDAAGCASIRETSWRTIVFFLLAGSVLSGCANWRAIHMSYEFSKNKTGALSVDAKQRVIIANSIKRADGTDQEVICAEPSPDALSALSSSTSLSAQSADKILNAAIASAESAASFGLRTPSIQLLRDGMYRICEMYASGALRAEDVKRLQRRYQNSMLSLLAIEQLTGAVVAQQVGLGQGRASASSGYGVADATVALAKADDQLKLADAAVVAAKKKLDDDKQSPTKTDAILAQDQADLDSKQQDYRKAADAKNTAEKNLRAAASAIAGDTTGATVSFSGQGTGPKITDASARVITEGVRTIVATTIIASFSQETCLQILELYEKEQDLRSATLALASKKNLGLPPDDSATRDKLLSQLEAYCTSAYALADRISFDPLYDARVSLRILSGSGQIDLPIGGAVSFPIVGGSGSIVATAAMKGPDTNAAVDQNELSVSVSHDGRTLSLERSVRAKLWGESATVYVRDSTNGLAELEVRLIAEVPDPPAALSSAFKDGAITLDVTAPSGIKPTRVTGYLISWTRTDTNTSKEVFYERDKQIVFACEADKQYRISVQSRNAGGILSEPTPVVERKCGP